MRLKSRKVGAAELAVDSRFQGESRLGTPLPNLALVAAIGARGLAAAFGCSLPGLRLEATTFWVSYRAHCHLRGYYFD